MTTDFPMTAELREGSGSNGRAGDDIVIDPSLFISGVPIGGACAGRPMAGAAGLGVLSSSLRRFHIERLSSSA
jgi:hypothetical protein